MSPRAINQVTGLLLASGWGAALIVYLTAKPVVFDPLIGNPLTSKKYLHELRVMGGKANVAFAEFEAWLASLWQGETRAVTVAVIVVIVTLAFRFVAARPDLYAPIAEPLPAPKPSVPEPKAPGTRIEPE
ncbi:hypothetical protein [Horticoccus sp. 23ND18S-11]|uniref:hypothetical protein n=1 Tax=Horticoccus sp. 23ND18S-11 TaxID=3391832 RepID=UPI0039C9E289